MNDITYSINKMVSAAGSLGTGVVKDQTKLRVVIENAAVGNVVRVRGRIAGQSDWVNLVDLTGSTKETVIVSVYDEVEFLVITYSSSSNHIRVIATSFNIAGGSTTIDAPAGGTITGEEITFTSSDSSISITNDPLTSTVNFTATGVGGLSKYSTIFNNTSDWVLNSGNYEYTVLAATHGNKLNPVIETFETIAGENYLIFPTIIRNSTNDIILQVTQVPDNRYTGRIIIL